MLKTKKIANELNSLFNVTSLEEGYSLYQYDLNVLDFINKGTRILKWENIPTGIDARTLNLQLFRKGR